jgi:hypothetical protein
MNLERLEMLTVLWHRDRNLIAGSTDAAQHTKLLEEVKELETNILLSQPVIDDIGDCMVVLINIAERNGLTLAECLGHAYNDIKDRKGKMINGVFVKEKTDQSIDGHAHSMAYLEGFNAGTTTPEDLSPYDKGFRAGILHNKGE